MVHAGPGKEPTARCWRCFWTTSALRASGRAVPRPDALLADKAYSPRNNRAPLRARRIRTVIAQRCDQQRHRHNQGSVGGRPVSFDDDPHRGRNVIKRSCNQLKQWRDLASRDDKLANVFQGGAIMRSIFIWLTAL